jgi:hypothetical protein
MEASPVVVPLETIALTEHIAEQNADGVLQASPSGRQGSARDLEPGADISLIAQIVQESSPAVHITPRRTEVA